jgi:hypothetical protein
VELESTWVTFTASRLDSSPSATVRPLGIEPSPAAYRAAARPSCYRRITSLCWSGWLDLPQRPPVPETGAHLPELHPEIGALVWNRTSTSWASARRHHQIGYKGIVVAGVVPGHEHRRLFGCQRARSLRHESVRGRGFEPRRAGSKPAGLPLADPRSAMFRDQDLNLDICVQSAAACH